MNKLEELKSATETTYAASESANAAFYAAEVAYEAELNKVKKETK